MREEAEQLVNAYSDLILRLSYTYLQSTHDAKDICQDVLLKLITREEPFENAEHEKAWVIRVTANACKNKLSEAFRQRVVELDEAAGCAAEDDLFESDVMEAVNKLSLAQREAIYLHYFEGYQVKEIARMLNKSPEAISMCLNRARSALREMLDRSTTSAHADAEAGNTNHNHSADKSETADFITTVAPGLAL